LSTIIMSQCWPLEGMSIAQKAVLISLADNANDQGVCWPSIPTIARRVCASERAVQNAIKWLEQAKVVTANRANGRHTSYMVTPAAYSPRQEIHPRTKCTGAGDSPAQEMHHTPAGNAGVPPQEVHQPPHQVPSNRNKPSKEPSLNRQSAPAKAEKAPTPFDRFWAAWPASPRKVDRKDCAKRWTRMGLDAIADQIIAHVGAMKGTQQWREGFEPAPATYLNGERWSDGIPVDTPKAAGGATGQRSDAAWWESAPGIEAKGGELGVAKKPGEEFWRYKVRVFKKAGEGKWRDDLLADMLRTKNVAYAAVYEFFYGHPPLEVAA
jgi:hypothetical protein